MASAQTSPPKRGHLVTARLWQCLVTVVAKRALPPGVRQPTLDGRQHSVTPTTFEVDDYPEASLPGRLIGCCPGREANRGS